MCIPEKSSCFLSFFFLHHRYIFFLSFASNRRLGKSQITIFCFLLSLLYANIIVVFVTFCSKVVKQFAANKVLIVNSLYSDNKSSTWRMKDLPIHRNIPQELCCFYYCCFFCFLFVCFAKSSCHDLTQKATKHNRPLHLLPPSGGNGRIWFLKCNKWIERKTVRQKINKKY